MSRITDMKAYIEANTMPIPFCGCWIWMGSVLPKGYGHSALGRSHRVAWTAFKGPIPAGLWVLHTCDVPACCNPDHLFLGTNQDNIDDKVRKGRARSGSIFGADNPAAVLTDSLVREIRQSPDGSRKLARRLGVSVAAVRRVKRRLTWRHVA